MKKIVSTTTLAFSMMSKISKFIIILSVFLPNLAFARRSIHAGGGSIETVAIFGVNLALSFFLSLFLVTAQVPQSLNFSELEQHLILCL